jgi:exodeoxyribonuclease V gamma subunit
MNTMSGLRLYTSNRLENLAKGLATVVRTPGPLPLAPEVVVVQSRGMERWVSLRLAKLNGICANFRFPFPNTFLKELFANLFPEMGKDSPYDPGVLTWRIMALLPRLCKQPAFARISSYLNDEYGSRKQYQLAAKIADTFDQYLVFRPAMLAAWEAGKTEHWQAMLWRELYAQCGPVHRGSLQGMLFERLQKDQTVKALLPQRLIVFGISYLPPFYLQTLAALARQIEIHLFVMNPCRQYWADIVSDREMQYISDGYDDQPDADLHLEKGNRLIASMGQVGRHFFGLINEFEGRIFEDFQAPAGPGILNAVQRDILDLAEGRSAKTIPPEEDRSLQIHSCHSAMREIEVLYDQMLAMLEADPNLKPEDIMVMTPDIEAYAPYIHAVFSDNEPGSQKTRVPYSVADQTLKREGRIVDTWLALLDLYTGRFEASRILALLDAPAVLARFDLGEGDLIRISKWVEQTQIRWGKDGDDESITLTGDTDANTWRHGIERLLLGYAMPARGNHLFAGRLPYEAVEGQQAQVLGRFLTFLESLFEVLQSLAKPRRPNKWQDCLTNTLERFFQDNRTYGPEIEIIRRVIGNMVEDSVQAGYTQDVSFEVMRACLEDQLARQGLGTGFMTGGVTFGTMLPMRSIPFKVICLLGMQDEAFPRETQRPGFDLLSRYPKPGDRSRRADDKYLFLEAILSARDTFYISYVGQSAQDNASLPPSVVVRELIDYVQDIYAQSAKRIVFRHRLQAFSPDYFMAPAESGQHLFSYSRENCQAASGLTAVGQNRAFIETPLLLNQDEGKTHQNLGVETLGVFFANPCRYLLKNRLGIDLESIQSVFKDRENFDLDPLQRYLIGSELAVLSQKGPPLIDHLKPSRATGLLPHANVGETVFRELSGEADHFAARLSRFMTGEPLSEVKIDLTVDNFRFSGHLDSLYPQGSIHVHYGTLKSKYILKTWCHHLLVCALDQGIKGRSYAYLICKDKGWQFLTVRDAQAILRRLLAFYNDGLCTPLKFFPEASFAFADAYLNRRKDADGALNAALQKWQGSDFSIGESTNPYIERCFGNQADVFNQDFMQMAVDIFEPIFNHHKLLW